MSPQSTYYPVAVLRRFAVAADVDPRSVRRELNSPGSVRGMPGERIRAVLRAQSIPLAISTAVAGLAAQAHR